MAQNERYHDSNKKKSGGWSNMLNSSSSYFTKIILPHHVSFIFCTLWYSGKKQTNIYLHGN